MNETLTKIQELEQRQQETEQFKETVFAEVLPLIIKLCTEVRAKVKNSTLPNFTADCSPYIDLRIIDLQVREDDVVIHYEEDEEDCTTVHTSFFKVSKELFNPELTSLVIAKRVQAAWELRAIIREQQDTTAYRWLFGEADGLPGMTIDLYGSYAVLVTYASSLKTIIPWVIQALRDVAPLDGIVQRIQSGHSGCSVVAPSNQLCSPRCISGPN